MGNACCSQDAKPSTQVVDLPADPAPAEEPVQPAAPKFYLTVVCAKGLRNADWMPGT
eukprot:CAMPEP_0179054928 /NCGR_PEP_ID=MMETSP0796-20121207/23039_1 /TAXON_ID=73915 /ORGANISM="Pyrodinium bahamense, Strain pbaha01" /LENGTH=56 /DNA_ID=CAMNT_0020751567 /DNA_START=73 /DNA_END=239 /DNA_ORIENTATION=-